MLHPSNDNVDIGYSVAYARVKPGETTYLHRLGSSEVYFIDGKGEIYVDGKWKEVIPPNSMQKIKMSVMKI